MKLLNRLRAVEFEIDAVASTVEEGKNVASGDDRADHDDNDDCMEKGNREDDESVMQLSLPDLTLQHALATDRLKSLKKTKAQLEKELSGLLKESSSEGIKHDKLIKAPKQKKVKK